MSTLIELPGGPTLYGTDPGGDAFMLVDFEGWDDSPSARGEVIERPADHGDFDLPVFRGPRVISMGGWCRASTQEGLQTLRDELMQTLADGTYGNLTVDHHDVERSVPVRLFGDPRFKRRGATLRATWSIKVKAADPRVYGEEHSFGGSGTSATGIHHDGNFPALPYLIVTGSDSDSYAITGPNSRRIEVAAELESGHPHTINMATGGLYIDGQRVVGGITEFEPWVVPPGSSVGASVSSGKVLTVTVKDTYV